MRHDNKNRRITRAMEDHHKRSDATNGLLLAIHGDRSCVAIVAREHSVLGRLAKSVATFAEAERGRQPLLAGHRFV